MCWVRTKGGVSCLAWLGASYVATGCMVGKVRLWDSQYGECVKTFKGHSGGISSLSAAAYGSYLVSWLHMMEQHVFLRLLYALLLREQIMPRDHLHANISTLFLSLRLIVLHASFPCSVLCILTRRRWKVSSHQKEVEGEACDP